MDDYKESYDKAETLIQSALKKLMASDIEGSSRDLELAHKYLKLATDETNMVQNNILYGESRNFGIIYNVFEQNTDKLFESKKGRATIRKFVQAIKSNPILQEQMNVYSSLSKKPSEMDVDEYITEVFALVDKYSPKTLRKLNEELIKVLQEGGVDEMVNITDENMALYEAIEYMLTTTKKISNIEEYNQNRKLIKEHLENIETVSPNQSVNNITENIDNICQKHDDLLNDDEIELIREINECADKRKLFDEYKKETLKMANKALTECDDALRTRISTITYGIIEKEYDEKRLLEDVAKFIEIQNMLSE